GNGRGDASAVKGSRDRRSKQATAHAETRKGGSHRRARRTICRDPCFPDGNQQSFFRYRIMLNEEVVIEALKAVKYPGYSRDIVSFGLVKQVAAGSGAVSVIVQLT